MRLQAWLILSVVLCCSHLRAETAAEQARAGGELVELRGYSVLRLTGTDSRSRGFAHGYYLAEQVLASLDDALRSLPWFGADSYEQQLRPWSANKFHWDADAKDELAGLYAGMLARLGPERLRSVVLDRALQPDDLFAINCIADWFGPACSGFTAWGKLTLNGKVIHGRNLDFPIGGRAVSNQVILAVAALPERAGRPARRAWIGVGWPGLVSLYSGMNDAGLVCCLHDSNNVKHGGADEGFVARGVLLRRILESVDPRAGDPGAASAKLAAERPTACGNLFHLSWPGGAGDIPPAAVLEFDAQDRDGGEAVQIRRMDASQRLVVTNHYCVRRAPQSCDRFAQIGLALGLLASQSQPIGVPEARRVLIAGKLAAAAHTLVFEPDDLRMTVSVTRGNVLSPHAAGTTFTLAELFAKP